jgi:hypothetical protein
VFHVFFLLTAAILTGTFSDSVAAVIAVSGFFGGAARYAAVLARQEHDKVERATANGFFFGFFLGLLCLLVDYLA